MTDLTRSSLAKIALAAWCNVSPEQLPAERVWIEHPDDLNRQAWERVANAIWEEYARQALKDTQ